MYHSFNTDIATKYGIAAATILNHLCFWIKKNEANGDNFHDGLYWTYCSRDGFEKLFPYLSARQIDYAIKKLIDGGIVITGNFNKSTYDRTLWYAITKVGYSILQNCEMEATNLSNGTDEIVRPIPDKSTYISTDIYNNSSLSTAREACAREDIKGDNEGDSRGDNVPNRLEGVSPVDENETHTSQVDEGDIDDGIEEAAEGTAYADFLANWNISDKCLSRYAAEKVVLIDWKKMDEKMRCSRFLQGVTNRGITYFINQSDRILAGEFDDDDYGAASRASPCRTYKGEGRKGGRSSIVDQIQWLKEQYKKEGELNAVDDG